MKKTIAVLLSLVMLFALTAAVAEGEFATIEKGKLTYATSPDFPPFESRDDEDNIVGIEPDIMALIGEKLGLEVEAVPMDFASALLAAQLGKTDLVVSGVTATGEKAIERSTWFDFTDTYVDIQQAIVFKEGADITITNYPDRALEILKEFQP